MFNTQNIIDTWLQVEDTILSLLKYDPKAPLIFSSGLFLFVFLIFALFYRFVRRDVLLRIVYLTAFSLFFYYKSSGIYFLILIFTATFDFFIARGIGKETKPIRRKLLLISSLLVNIGMLVYFKYTNLFIQIANDLAGGHWLDFQKIFLPVGISFFIFQTLSYSIDVYKKQLKPLDSWLDYLFYLSFFPQVAAGPIVRARDFIPQIRQNPIVITKQMFGMGVFLIITGLFKKAIISDYISLNFVDRVFDDPTLYTGFENLMGLYGYALQIYCDFSGYSDMAIGLALILGFHFNLNFDSPYKSATVTEFWRRWHISLSSWLKDYLYIPLGGSRKGKVRTYINLMLTMLIGGLWHGAALRFVLWGGLHGVALAIHKFVMEHFSSFKPVGSQMSRVRRAIGILITFNFVCFTWIFFRAKDMTVAKAMIRQIFTNFQPQVAPEVIKGYGAIAGLMVIGYALHLMPKKLEIAAQNSLIKSSLIVKAGLLIGLIWVVMQIKSSDIQPFIYFQF